MKTLEEALRAIASLTARVASLEAASGLFASDKDLDGQRGDPVVKFVPRGWRPIYKGKRFSGCDPEFLDALAESLAWSAEHPREGKEQYAQYDKLDSARARGWARRLRAGWRRAAPAVSTVEGEIIDGQYAEVEPFASTSFEAPDFEAPSFDEESPL